MFACDIDNTLANLHDEICRVLNTKTLTRYPTPMPDGFWGSDAGLSIYREVDPLEGSAKIIRRLAAGGIVYVTNRSLEIAEITKEWLARHGYPPGQIIFCGRQEKARVYGRLDVSLIAEDDPFVLSGLAGIGKTVLAKQWVYNGHLSGGGILPVQSWAKCGPKDTV